MQKAAAHVDDGGPDETCVREQPGDFRAVACRHAPAPRDAEADGKPFLRRIQPPLPAWPSPARERDEEPAGFQSARGPREEIGSLLRRHEVEHVDKGRLRKRAHGSGVDRSCLETADRRLREPAARAIHLPGVGIEAEVRSLEPRAEQEVREEARPAAEIHEGAARLEGPDHAPPWRAPKPEIEMGALRQYKRRGGLPERGRFPVSESQRGSRGLFGVPIHGRP